MDPAGVTLHVARSTARFKFSVRDTEGTNDLCGVSVDHLVVLSDDAFLVARCPHPEGGMVVTCIVLFRGGTASP